MMSDEELRNKKEKREEEKVEEMQRRKEKPRVRNRAQEYLHMRKS